MKRKAAMRAEAAARRSAACRALGNGAGAALRDHLLAQVPVRATAVVGSYWPFGDEIDPRPLLYHAHAQGHACCLPEVVAAREPLVFRRWQPGDALRRGAFGEPQPRADATVLDPTFLVVPLLAFDRRGYRLGYGGGFYDRTLAQLRSAATIVAVGVAYSAQEVDSVPVDATDARLDWIVTEREAISIAVD